MLIKKVQEIKSAVLSPQISSIDHNAIAISTQDRKSIRGVER